MYIYYLTIINVLLLVTGQALWKIGLGKVGGVRFDTAFSLLMSPYIIVGLFLYALATVVWFILLSKADLSTVYPMQSFAYVLGVIVGWQLFHETISVTKWIGSVVIIVGIVLVSK